MKKVIKLKESQFTDLVKKVIKEERKKQVNEVGTGLSVLADPHFMVKLLQRDLAELIKTAELVKNSFPEQYKDSCYRVILTLKGLMGGDSEVLNDEETTVQDLIDLLNERNDDEEE